MHEKELILCDLLKCSRADLYASGFTLSNEQKAYLQEVIKRRSKGEPLQYILGNTEFMGLEFKVSRSVFIPRPETEILVEKAIDLVRKSKIENRKLKILDIGTGSGCIAVSLAKYLTNIEITATDISKEALEIAQENALLNGVADKINFVLSDLFSSIELQETSYDIIISNPPYIKTADIENLQNELSYEPHIAQDAGPDGLRFYRRILVQAADFLKTGGFLLMEMGFGESGLIKEIARETNKFEIVDVVLDYAGIERAIVLKLSNQ
ncbi:MAG: peptide chain release factor N(5)-glutamine methyltransferase [Candidatus Omnitrophota bacterium]